MRRASTSVSANIAEGVCRLSEKEKARFMEVAYGSLMEVSNFMEISLRLKLINEDEYVKVRIDIKKLSNKLNAFHKILKMKK